MVNGLCHICFSSGNKLIINHGNPECEECSKKTKIKG
jgi:hypothetical protein